MTVENRLIRVLFSVIAGGVHAADDPIVVPVLLQSENNYFARICRLWSVSEYDTWTIDIK